MNLEIRESNYKVINNKMLLGPGDHTVILHVRVRSIRLAKGIIQASFRM